jgi:hypothetical protein
MIQKGSFVEITAECSTPKLWGLVGVVVRVPRNDHYIVKFKRDSNIYIFASKEVKEILQ